MAGLMIAVTPPSRGDVLIAAQSLGWPRVAITGLTLEGEAAWRRALATANHAACSLLWRRLPDVDAQGRAVVDFSEFFDRVRPSASQERIFWLAVRHARSKGLQIPPGVSEVEWFAHYEGAASGFTFHLRRPILILLNAALEGRRVFEVTLHELRHAADARYPHLSKDELEARAERFTAWAMKDARW